RRPCADQHAPRAQLPNMLEQRAADAAALAARQDVSVTDEIDIAYRLKSHHAGEPAALLVAPEHDASRDFAVELVPRHGGFMPSIGRDDAAIGFGGGVDDREDCGAIIVMARADRAHGIIVVRELARTMATGGPIDDARAAGGCVPFRTRQDPIAMSADVLRL